MCEFDGCTNEARYVKTGLCGGHYMQKRAGKELVPLRKKRINKKVGNAQRALEHYYRRVNMIRKIKVERGCADCGYNQHPAALEFDHISNNKTANVSKLITYKWDTVLAEIAKCEVVCVNCHRVRTEERKLNLLSGGFAV